MVGVLGERRGNRAIRGARAVAIEAEDIGGLSQICGVFRAVDIVACEARDPVSVHQAGNVVVPLHPVFMTGPVAKVGKCRLAQLVLLQSPVVAQCSASLVTHGPIIVLALDWIVCRPPL